MFLPWRAPDELAIMNQKNPSTWTVYLIEAESGKLYTGISTDPERRLKEHREGKKGARYFRFSKPVRIIHQEQYPDRSSASKREAQIKKMKREEKLNLCRQAGPCPVRI